MSEECERCGCPIDDPGMTTEDGRPICEECAEELVDVFCEVCGEPGCEICTEDDR